MPTFDDDELPEDAGPRIRDLHVHDQFEVWHGRGLDRKVVYRGVIAKDGLYAILPTADPTMNDDRPLVRILDEQVFANQVKSGWRVSVVGYDE